MAEAVGLISLIADVSKTIKGLIDYTKAVRGARSNIERLSEELFALEGILKYLPAQTELEPQLSESNASAPFDRKVVARVLQTTSKLKRLRQKLEWSFTKQQFETHLARLERVKSWLILVITNDSASLNRDIHGEMIRLAVTLEKDLTIRDHERDQVGLLSWLAPVSPASAHLRESKHREIETGRWFIDGPLQQWPWRSDKQMKFLFLEGKSGAGKTTLFAQTVNELTAISPPEGAFSLAYFYCEFDYTASQDPVNILGSLVAQLSDTIPSILESIRPLYEKTPNGQAHRHPIDINALEDAIVKYSSHGTRVILIDAINESQHIERIKQSLQRIASLSTNLRILITSTVDVISPAHAKIVNMNTENIRVDIDAFIYYRLEEEELKQLSTTLKNKIRTTLSNGADGSFRWARLSLDNLSAQRTEKSVREALRELPGTLRETFTKRPLTLRELNEAVVLEETSTALNDDMRLISPHALLQICQGLITQDRSGNVTLTHSSIKGFLTSEWIRSSGVHFFSLDPSTADQTVMRKCLAYLCLDNFRPGYTSSAASATDRLEAYPFLGYAAQFWAIHGASCQFEDRDRVLVNRLFETKCLPRRGNFGVWVQTLIPHTDVGSIEATHPLYYAASFGLVPVVNAILTSDPEVKINAPGGRFRSTPLFVACWRHNYEVADLLLACRKGTCLERHRPRG